MINPELRAKDRIYSELPNELKKLMKEHILSEEEHMKVLDKIKKVSYENKQPVENPKFTIVVGQTGSGKSNLTSSLYKKDNNVVIIDSDKYKAYRSDSEEILKNHLVEYAFLTAPDAYLHRDEMLTDAINKRYNILMECATSQKDGLFIDVFDLLKKGYKVEMCAIGVSSLNSLLSLHERYESEMQLKYNAAKLTKIDRHDDSFKSLNKVIGVMQRYPQISIKVFKRGKEYLDDPEMIYCSTNGEKRFSCALEAIMYAQSTDEKKTLQNFEKRYNIIREQMNIRNAPKAQMNQLDKVKERYERNYEKNKRSK